MRRRAVQAMAVLSVAVVLVVAGCSSDDDDTSEEAASESSVELPSEAAEALEAYTQASAVDTDGAAVLETVTEDYTFLSVGETVLDRDAYAAEVDNYSSDFTVVTIGEDVVVGGEDTYVVSRANEVTDSGFGFASTGFSVFRVVEVEDGVWLVDAHRFTGD